MRGLFAVCRLWGVLMGLWGMSVGPAQATVYTDNFNDNTPTGWTHYGAGYSENESRIDNTQGFGGGEGRYNSDLATENMYAQIATYFITNTNPGMRVGPAVRFSSTARTCYVLRVNNDNGPDDFDIAEVTNGTHTIIGDATWTYPNGTLKITVDGNHIIKGYYAGTTENISVDDSGSPLTGNKRAGFTLGDGQGSINDVGLDNWETGDLAAAGPKKGAVMVVSVIVAGVLGIWSR